MNKSPKDIRESTIKFECSGRDTVFTALRAKYNCRLFFPCLDQSHRYDGRTLLFFDRRPPISAIIACTGLVNSCDFVICDNIDYIADSYSYKYTLVAFLLPNRTLRRSCYLFRKSRIAWRSKFARTTHAKIKTHLRITFVPDSFRSSIIVEIFFYLFFCFFFFDNQKRSSVTEFDDEFYDSIWFLSMLRYLF